MGSFPSVVNYPEELSEEDYSKISSRKYIKHMYKEEPRYCGGCHYYIYYRRSQDDFEAQYKNANLVETQRRNIGLM